eukprot:SAG31_NODE_5551_length_2464_cov_1.834249_2_plen_114_part_00
MFLFHQHSEKWSEALAPTGLYSCLICKRCRNVNENSSTKKSAAVRLHMSDDVKLRHQLYSQIFFVLDSNYNGSLDADEISQFGEYAMGADWSKKLAVRKRRFINLLVIRIRHC